MKEEVKRIGEKIVQQIQLEKSTHSRDESIGYLEGKIDDQDVIKWILREDRKMTSQPVYDMHGCVIDYLDTGATSIYPASQTIVRDSKVGRIISQGLGKHEFDTNLGRKSAITDILALYSNKSKYGGDAVNGSILIQDPKTTFRFASLVEELEHLNKLTQQKEDISYKLNQIAEETAEAKSLATELQEREAEIAALGERVRRHIAMEVELRDQPILDKYQEDIKRSKILDGTLIINGGPGTGKTTSLIQRIKYLTSPTILEETGPLPKEKAEVLFDSNKSWMFYSPSELLRNYLANAMQAEGLIADEDKVLTWAKHRRQLLRQTGLVNPETKRPFISRRDQGKDGFLNNRAKTFALIDELFITEFLDIQKVTIGKIHDSDLTKFLENKLSFTPADHVRSELKSLIIRMQDASKRALSFRKLEDWLPFFISFQREFEESIKEINKKLSEDINLDAARLQIKIRQDVVLLNWFEELVTKDEVSESTSEEEIAEEDELDEDLAENDNNPDIRAKIDRKLKQILRIAAIRTIDAAGNRLTPKNRIVYDKIENLLNPDKLQVIGIRQFFKKHFEKATKGVEFNLLNTIPTNYKKFRRTILNGDAQCLTSDGIELCNRAIKDNNKPLYPDEADYVLGLIFRVTKALFNRHKQYFDQSNHPYILAYKENIKAVVAIDEATDFSIWELFTMSQLAHPYFESVTLSGDLMQRMTKKGLRSWNDFTDIVYNTDIRDLKIAYRQTAKLLDIASEIYSWNVSEPAEFKSYAEADDLDPDPLLFIGDDIDQKLKWLVERILEIQVIYGRNFPTVAIFVKDDSEVLRVHRYLEDNQDLESAGLNVVACLQGQILGDKQSIRIFSVEYIKGLEFGAVFFLDLDQLSNDSDELLNKYIYVGLSRANLFLGITLNHDFNENLVYLKPLFKTGSWKKSEI